MCKVCETLKELPLVKMRGGDLRAIVSAVLPSTTLPVAGCGSFCPAESSWMTVGLDFSRCLLRLSRCCLFVASYVVGGQVAVHAFH